MADDPYAQTDPYASPLANAVITGGYDPKASAAFTEQHRTAMAQREKEMQENQGKQQMNVDQMSKLLDDTASRIRESRKGNAASMLLSLGANMMGPGNFGDQVGRGLRGLSGTMQHQEDQSVADEEKIAGLQLKGAELRNAPLKEKMDYLKALQTGDLAAIRANEAAQIRGATKTATGKMALIEQLKAENPGMSTEQALQKLQELSERNPAQMQEVDRINRERKDAGQPPLSYVDAVAEVNRRKQEASATGHTQGTAQATAALTLPEANQRFEQANAAINAILNNPKLDQYVGQVASKVPDLVIPGKHDFNIQHDNLASQLFPLAIQPLVHMGALSNVEGEALTRGFAMLDRTGSPELYRKGLRDLQQKLQTYIEIARQKASGSVGAAAGKPVPPAAGSPSPPSQTGQTQPSGDAGAPSSAKPVIIDGPNGPMILQDGKWVPHHG